MKFNRAIMILGIIIVFIIVNFSLFNQGLHSWDIRFQQEWGNIALEKELSAVYIEGKSDYTPLYLYALKFNSWLSLNIFGSNEVLNPQYIFISKLMPLFFNLIIGLILLFLFIKKDFKKAVILLSLYLFNLAIIYNTSYWGQVDSANILFMFLSILFVINRRYLLSSIFITLAILTKFQSVILLPIIGLLILINCDLKNILKIILTNLGIVFLILLPFIINGAFSYVISVYFGAIGRYPWITVNAFNLWYLLYPYSSSDFGKTLSDNLVFGGVSFRVLSLLFLFIYTLLVLYQLYKKRDKESIILAASSLALAFFILPTQIHERYIFPFFGLFALIALKNKKYLSIYLILMVTFLLNLMMILPFNGINLVFTPIQIIINLLIFFISYKFLAIVISLTNILTFLYLSKIGIMKGLVNNIKNDISKIKK